MSRNNDARDFRLLPGKSLRDIGRLSGASRGLSEGFALGLGSLYLLTISASVFPPRTKYGRAVRASTLFGIRPCFLRDETEARNCLSSLGDNGFLEEIRLAKFTPASVRGRFDWRVKRPLYPQEPRLRENPRYQSRRRRTLAGSHPAQHHNITIEKCLKQVYSKMV